MENDPREKALRDAIYRAIARLTERAGSHDEGNGPRKIAAVPNVV